MNQEAEFADIPFGFKEEAALKYAQMGWKVFPLHYPVNGGCSCGKNCGNIGKHPLGSLCPNGVKDATADEEQIQRWWEKFPYANIGIAMDGKLGLDVDGNKGGEESLAQLLNGEREPDTPQSITGHGRHFYFELPADTIFTNTTGFLPGIDIKNGPGAYLVAPPSVHESGKTYEWEASSGPGETAIAPIPQWLLQLLEEGERGEPKSAIKELRKIQHGQRHGEMISLSGTLKRRGSGPDAIFSMLKAFYETSCVHEPPMSDREIRGMATGELGAEEKKIIEPYPVLTITDILEAPPVEWLVEDVWFDRSFHEIVGYTGLGKSMLVLSLAESIAGGSPLFGKYKVQRTGPVLIVDEENSESDLRDRFEKMRISEDLPIYFVSFQGFYIDDNRCYDRLLATIEKVGAIQVFFDSLTRIHRANENIASEMAPVMGRFREICNKGTGAAPIHHHGKGDSALEVRSRGSSDIVGACDVEYALYRESKQSEILVLESVKSRRARIQPIRLSIEAPGNELFMKYHGDAAEQAQRLAEAITSRLQEKPSSLTELWEWLVNSEQNITEKILRGHLIGMVDKGTLKISTGAHNRKEYSVC